MIYEEFEIFKIKYYEAQKKYNDILTEKEKLFARTQPKATDYSKERVNGGMPGNPFDDYLIQKEKRQLDQRLNEVKSILDDRERLLNLKEEELRCSNNIQDKIYRYRYIEKMRIEKICRLVGYGEAQVYRILRSIKNNLK